MKTIKCITTFAIVACFTLGTLSVNAQGNSEKARIEKKAKGKADKGKQTAKEKQEKELKQAKEKVNAEQKELADARKAEMKALQEEMKNASPDEKKAIQEKMERLKEEYREENRELRSERERIIEDEIKVLENRRKEIKSNNGRGNAYGKNKGNLSGREFGQQRAFEARNRIEVEQEIIQKRRNLVVLAEERIENSRRRLEKDIEEGQIEEEEVMRRRGAISKATDRLTKLKASLSESERILNNQKEKLEKLAEKEEN